MRRDRAVKKCLDAVFPRRRHAPWAKTSHQILTSVHAGTVFDMIEGDVCVPEALRANFAEMQPSDARRSRSVHAPIRRRTPHHGDFVEDVRWQLLRR